MSANASVCGHVCMSARARACMCVCVWAACWRCEGVSAQGVICDECVKSSYHCNTISVQCPHHRDVSKFVQVLSRSCQVVRYGIVSATLRQTCERAGSV